MGSSLPRRGPKCAFVCCVAQHTFCVKVSDVGFEVWGWGLRFGVWGLELGFGVWGLWFMVWRLELVVSGKRYILMSIDKSTDSFVLHLVQGLWFRVKGFWFWVWGVGFRV